MAPECKASPHVQHERVHSSPGLSLRRCHQAIAVPGAGHVKGAHIVTHTGDRSQCSRYHVRSHAASSMCICDNLLILFGEIVDQSRSSATVAQTRSQFHSTYTSAALAPGPISSELHLEHTMLSTMPLQLATSMRYCSLSCAGITDHFLRSSCGAAEQHMIY
ncbi:hypothetical protein T440DRAFT_432613, partial [Plenodomus tracheiphilus IPT5]